MPRSNNENKRTFKDIEAELNAMLDGIESFDVDLLEVVRTIIQTEMVSKITTKANQGTIKRSIQAVQTADNLNIEIVNYGMFQNYGVNGLVSGSAIPNHEGYTYKFGVKAQKRIERGELGFYHKTWKYGIKAKKWFDVEDVIEKIEVELQRRLTA